MNGSGGLLRQPTAAWLRAIGRVRPGASIEAVGPRLTAVLHQWLEHDSGYPSNWMPDVMRRCRSRSSRLFRPAPASA